MKTNALEKSDKKQALLEQIKKIQGKIDGIEIKRLEKINQLAKKFKLLDLDDQIIANEFALIMEKYAATLMQDSETAVIKKN